MLCLTRKAGESILIGENVEVQINSVDRRRGTVKVGVTAPEDILILRDELAGKDANNE